MKKGFGKRVWVFTDGFRPFEGQYKEKGHESIMVINATNTPANIELTVFFTDKPPLRGKRLTVDAQRVRCFRTSNVNDMDGFVPGYNEKYSMLLESNVEIVAQYGVLDTTDQPMHMYTVMGYPCME